MADMSDAHYIENKATIKALSEKMDIIIKNMEEHIEEMHKSMNVQRCMTPHEYSAMQKSMAVQRSEKKPKSMETHKYMTMQEYMKMQRSMVMQ